MRERTFLTLCLLILVNQLGFGLITPVLPAYARSFGLGAGGVGLIVGSYGLARFLANVPAGQLAERRGRRAVLIIGTLITSVASALIAVAQNLPQLLAFRVLAGLGAATVLTGGQIMVGDLAPPERRGRMMSTYQGFFLVGVGLGPTPGGILADTLGLRAPFVAYAVFSLLACVMAAIVIKETKPAGGAAASLSRDSAAEPEHEPAMSVRAVVLGAPFLLVGLISFVQFFARTGAMFTIVPLLGKDRIGLSASQIGVAMTLVSVLNIATLYHAGVLSDRAGRKLAIVPATLVSGISVALWSQSGSYGMYIAAALLWGLGSGISGPSPGAYVADIIPPSRRAQAFGLYRSVADAGYIVGPPLLGWMAGAMGYTAPLMMTAGMFVLSGLLFWRFAPEIRRPAPVSVAVNPPTGEPASRLP